MINFWILNKFKWAGYENWTLDYLSGEQRSDVELDSTNTDQSNKEELTALISSWAKANNVKIIEGLEVRSPERNISKSPAITCWACKQKVLLA